MPIKGTRDNAPSKILMFSRTTRKWTRPPVLRTGLPVSSGSSGQVKARKKEQGARLGREIG